MKKSLDLTNPSEVGVQDFSRGVSLVSAETERSHPVNLKSELRGGAGFQQGGLAWILSKSGDLASFQLKRSEGGVQDFSRGG